MKQSWRIIPIDTNYKFSKLWVYQWDYMIWEKINFFLWNELLNLFILRNKENEEKMKWVNWLDVVDVEWEKEWNNFYAKTIDVVQKNRNNIKELLKHPTPQKWNYKDLLFTLFQEEEKNKFELFNTVIHNLDSTLYDEGYFRVYLNQLQDYFQWWWTDWAYRTWKKYLKLTSEFDLRTLLNAWYWKVYHIWKSFRNIDKTETSLNEFNVLELIDQSKTAQEWLKSHIDRLIKVIDTIPEKYKHLLNKKNIDTLKSGQINFIPYEEFSKSWFPEKDWIYCVCKYPVTRSPLWKHWDWNYSEEYLLFCNWFCIWNILQIENDVDALVKWLDEQWKYQTDENKKGKANIADIESYWTPDATWIWMGVDSFVRFLLWEADIREVNIFSKL